jgi:hypothetical protein
MGGVGASIVLVAAAELETGTIAQQPAASTVHKRIRFELICAIVVFSKLALTLPRHQPSLLQSRY